ncbi:hypothetical protein MNV49_002419 [Pseudohyphozyma bogoriensis]|nr:hypothetical protein MNV49_002419 [Pseudohyphozyma bogoriensis]
MPTTLPDLQALAWHLAHSINWTAVLKYTVIAVVSLRILVSFLLAVLCPALSIASIGLFSIGNITWRSPSKSKRNGKSADEDRITVKVGRVGWGCAMGGWRRKRKDGCAASSAWLVLKVSNVRVTIPKSWIVNPSAPKPPRPSRAHHDDDQHRPKPPSRLLSLLPSLFPFLSLFAIEIAFELQVETALSVRGTLSAGTSLTRSRDLGTRLASWLALDGFRVVEVPPKPNDKVAQPRHKGPSPPTPKLWPAVEIKERVSIVASAPFGPEMVGGGGRGLGRASVNVAVVFGKGLEGVHVRVHELKRILRSVEDLQREKRRAAGPMPRLEEESEAKDGAQSTKITPKEDAPPTALFFLRTVELTLPLVVISAHYNTPIHVLAASQSNRPLPQSVAFALTVKDVAGKVWLGGTSDDAEMLETHRAWMGRERELACGAKFEWREIVGRIKADGSEEDILPNSNKAFSIARTSLAMTSTWLPPALASALPRPAHSICSPRNFNDDTVVTELAVGTIRGHATFETLDNALRIFNARPRPPPRAAESDHVEKTSIVRNLPRIAGAVTFDGTDIRIQAPLSPDAARARDGDAEDKFFRSWTSPDIFCISLPNGAVTFGGEYSDRSVRRTEAQRRAAKRSARRARESVDGEALSEEESLSMRSGETSASSEVPGEGVGWRPTRDLEMALGVPPPPPIHGHAHERRHLPARPNLASSDIEARPLSYSTRFNVTTDTLNIFILATNDGSHEDESAAWLHVSAFLIAHGVAPLTRLPLQESPTLPSDPIRLDILAIGPLEVGGRTTLCGWEALNADSTAHIPSLELSSRAGDVNILVEQVGVDLWRPPVMSSIRDFLSSFASAKATSTTLPAHHSSPPPPPKPLVNILPDDICVYIAVASLDMRIAGSDPKNDILACRGVAAHSDLFIMEYLLQGTLTPGIVDFPQRLHLELREDIRVEANANLAKNPDKRQALFKISCAGLHLDPVVDARSSRGHTRQSSSINPEENTSEDWELKNRANISDLVKRRKSILPVRIQTTNSTSIVSIPEIAVRIRLHAKEKPPPKLEDSPREGEEEEARHPLDELVVSVESEAITLRVELFSIYLCLVAIAALRSLSPPRESRSTLDESKSSSPPKRPSPHVSIRAEVADFHLFLTLPHNVPLYAHLRRLRVQVAPEMGVIAEWDLLLVAGHSPTVRGKWDDLIRFRITTVTIKPEPGNDGFQPFVVGIVSDSARLRIPFRYIFSQIVDNAANLVKSLKQLVHQLVKGGEDWILEPEVETAKRLPKIDLAVKMFAVEIQDDPFETRLNIIWRAGYEEQLARLEREAAFEDKVEAIRKMEAQGGEEESDDSGEESAGPAMRKPKVTGKHSIGIEEARHDLKAYDSSHWVKRMRNAIAEQARREEALTRRLYGVKHNTARPDNLLPIEILPTSRSAPLARATFQDLRFVITRPSFGEEGLADYLHDVGKGLPRDTQFTLLVPIHFSWKMEEARVQLRDYPLPLLHIPPMSPGGGHENASWECESDLVIAEETGGPESIRRVPCAIIPSRAGNSQTGLYSITIPRSAMTVKTYATPTIKIRSPYATRIGWGNSIQPAIQDVAKVLDTLTKATPDPSDRIGFWDKLRLQLHWRIQILFQGEGPVNFHLKGTRDPYAVIGFGAGFVKSWRGHVKFLLGLPNEDREFFQITSDEYILGIPNLREYVDAAASGMARDPGEDVDRSTQHSTGTNEAGPRRNFSQEADFVKVCAKFINGVRWGMGAVLERACPPDCQKPGCIGKTPFHRQCRFFDFIPHWEVHTKTAASIGPTGKVDDSFAGFRSDFIHFSISLTSPLTLSLPSHTSKSDDSTPKRAQSGYNSLHFGPQASTHFWAWWRLFDGSMSLPIRQGKLFPSAQAPSKKFGKHCATIKYRFSLAPLFISHTYRQETWKEWANGETTVVGLKGKIGRFNVDLHQREQEETVKKPGSNESKTILHKSFYRAEVDCDGVDLRVLSAKFREVEKQMVVPEDADESEFDEALPANEDYTVADEDLDWVDLDDYVDAIYTIADRSPKLRVLPFMVCPRFTYYRHTDVQQQPETDDEGAPRQEVSTSKFGTEPSHTCLMGCATDTITVQIESAMHRLEELQAQARSATEIALRINAVQRIIDRLVRVRDSREAAEDGEDDDRLDENHPYVPKSPAEPSQTKTSPVSSEHHEDAGDDAHLPHITSTLYQEWGEWTNRYMIHNPSIQVSNTIRDILLKYYYSSRERKGLSYHLSAKAIKFIRDLDKERDRTDRSKWHRRKSMRTGSTTRKSAFEEAQKTNRLLDDLVSGGGSFWAATEESGEGRRTFGDALDVDPDSAAESLPESFDLHSGHLCMFIKPQVSLQSDVDERSTIIITAFRAQLKAFQVIDLTMPDDPINRHVLTQTFATLDGLQAFYPRGHVAKRENTAFVPLETLVDLRVEPWGFDRVVPRTSAALRYDKFNQLRVSALHGGDEAFRNGGPRDSHFTTGTDRMSVECDRFSVSANPDHFAAVYNVVTDLLLYSDPLQKSRNKKLEELVFTHDFSNLAGVADTVGGLQQRIRQLGELGQLYQVHLDELDDEGRLDLFVGRAELAKLSAELNMVVQSISRAQTFNGPKVSSTSKTAGIQFEARASELVWHMHDKSDTPFAKFSVKGVEFSWISKQDSSVSNRLVIKDLRALNSSPEQVFAEIIAKHEHAEGDHELCKVDVFAAILWNSLAPVGGISIVEQFELHIHPVRLQLEHRVGRRILDYLFVQRRKGNGDDSSEKKRSATPTPKPSPSASTSSLSPLAASNGRNRSAESLVPSVRHVHVAGRPLSYLGDDRSPLSTPNRSSTFLTPSSASVNGDSTRRLHKAPSTEVLTPQGQEEGLDAEEMRLRASLNRTFVLVDFTPTLLYLTYRAEKEDHSSLPNIYNITYRTPSIQYRNKTWSFLDLLDEIKRDTIKSVWSQKGALLGQLLSTAHRRLPLQDARSAAKKSISSSIKTRLHIKRSASPSIQELKNASSPLRASSMMSTSSSNGGSSHDASPVVTREDTPDSSDSDSDEDEEEGDIPIRVFGEDVPLSSEPDSLSLADNGSRRSGEDSSSSSNGRHSFRHASGRNISPEDSILAGLETHSLPPSLPTVRRGLTAEAPLEEHPNGAKSAPPVPVLTRSPPSNEAGYPHHHPLTKTSSKTDEEKAQMLLGRSFK